MTDRATAFLQEADALLKDAEVIERKIKALRAQFDVNRFRLNATEEAQREKIHQLEDWRLELIAKAHSLRRMVERGAKK